MIHSLKCFFPRPDHPNFNLDHVVVHWFPGEYPRLHPVSRRLQTVSLALLTGGAVQGFLPSENSALIVLVVVLLARYSAKLAPAPTSAEDFSGH